MINSTNTLDTKAGLILVEPGKASGVKTVGIKIWKKEDLAQKSEEAMNRAMNTIQNMAKKINETIDSIEEKSKPDNVGVEFGLKFDGELDVIIAKVGVEASIVVTLNWQKKLSKSIQSNG